MSKSKVCSDFDWGDIDCRRLSSAFIEVIYFIRNMEAFVWKNIIFMN